MIWPSLSSNSKTLLANFSCFALLLVYTITGGFIFLYFEKDNSVAMRSALVERKYECILGVLNKGCVLPKNKCAFVEER